MYIVDVIPLSRGFLKEQLSYFASEFCPPGALVLVPLRRQKKIALVIRSRDAREQKAVLRKSDFALKKIIKIRSSVFFTPAFIKSAEETTRFFAGQMGPVLEKLVPNVILEHAQERKEIQKQIIGPGHKKTLIQGDEKKRFEYYKKIIKKNKEKGLSTFIVFPSFEAIKRAEAVFRDQNTHCLHSRLVKKKTISLWTTLLEKKGPVVIIASPYFLCLPRHDIGCYILDSESSEIYKNPSRPFFDLRFFVEKLAEQRKVPLFLGDYIPRTETFFRIKEGKIKKSSDRLILSSSSKTEVIDMKKIDQINKQKREIRKIARIEFEPFSLKLKKEIKEALANKKRVFLFGTRKGLHPLTLCGDCGGVVVSKAGHPMVLYEKEKGNEFVCRLSGERRPALEVCQNCGSWKLLPFGVGTDLISKHTQKLFPRSRIFQISKDLTPTTKKARETAEEFNKTPGSVMVGTEMALRYISSVDISAIVSLDSLFSIPHFSIQEKIFRVASFIKHKTRETFILQTRETEQKIIQLIKNQDLESFYKNEINERKNFSFPPFALFIKISVSGKKIRTEREIARVSSFFSNHSIVFAESWKTKSLHKKILIITVPRESWTDEKLLKQLRDLPPYFEIDIEPLSLL